jgi:hypothetical protein
VEERLARQAAVRMISGSAGGCWACTCMQGVGGVASLKSGTTVARVVSHATVNTSRIHAHNDDEPTDGHICLLLCAILRPKQLEVRTSDFGGLSA